ncbi:putative ubiquinone biosynthesis monooxygenase [Dispira simplex]|nr:putative ubiquinone biosynthesis monooxygenase [Dispira simplex]
MLRLLGFSITRAFHRQPPGSLRRFSCLISAGDPLAKEWGHLSRSVFRGQRGLSTHTDTPELFDIVIVGGGIAGATLANGLGKSPWLKDRKIALVESSDMDKVRTWSPASHMYSSRTVSITPPSQALLQGE